MPGGRIELEEHTGESEKSGTSAPGKDSALLEQVRAGRCQWELQRNLPSVGSCKRDLSHSFLCTNSLQNGAKRR